MSRPPELYACIHVRELPAQALLRLRPELHDKPCVVLEGEPSTETVCALNTRARLFGLRRGMTKVEVETFESVMVLQRSPIAETAVRAILLECAGAFSPRIEDRSASGLFVCVVDVAGTEGLFGPPLMLAKQMRQRIRSVGIVASVTISANVHTAVCLARGLSGDVPVRIVPRGEEAKALALLPVTVLGITEAQDETFRTWGIRSVAAVAALPERSLIARLGQDAKRLLQLAHGKHPHLLQPIDVPFVLEEQAELDSPLDDLESLLFGLSTMHLSDTPLEYAHNIRALVDVIGVDHVCIGTDTKLTQPSPRRAGPPPGDHGGPAGPGGPPPGSRPGRLHPQVGERTNLAWEDQTAGFYYVVVDAMLKIGFTPDEIGRSAAQITCAFSLPSSTNKLVSVRLKEFRR